jgi:hypothetical protein
MLNPHNVDLRGACLPALDEDDKLMNAVWSIGLSGSSIRQAIQLKKISTRYLHKSFSADSLFP